MRALPKAGLLTLAGISAACAGEGDAPAYTVRDSAGFEIVESVRPAWEEGGGWSVARAPTLRIGVVEGDPAYQFTEVVGAVRLDDGTLAVADFSQEVRFFDSEGDFLAVAGGRGEGPGEFTGLASLGHGPGDRVWAWDFGLRRITWLDGRGRVVDVVSLDPEPPMLSPVGPLAEGDFVLKQLWGAARVARARALGFRRDPVAFVRFDSAGVLADTVALLPGRELHITELGGRPVMNTPLVGRNAVGAVRGGAVLMGDQERFEVEERAADGALVRLLRIPDRDLALPASEADALLERRLVDAPAGERPGLRETYSAIPMPDRRPAYSELVVDRGGNLWASEWALFPRFPGRWTVLDPRGHWLGEVEMPEGFYPLDIGGDWILGMERDEVDVEYVVLRRLVKG